MTNPDEMFSMDRFHPSAVGYKRTAKALLPSLLAALGVRDDVPCGHQAPALAAAEEVVVAATRRTVLRVRGGLPGVRR